MLPKRILAPILDDDALNRGLGDAEARMLVEWLVEEAEWRSEGWTNEEVVGAEVRRLCRWGRGVAKFVELWCHQRARGAAAQLAASEGFAWPLPEPWCQACEVMDQILAWQDRAGFAGAALCSLGPRVERGGGEGE